MNIDFFLFIGLFPFKASCIGATTYVGWSPSNPLDTYFYAGFRGLTLEKIVDAFGSSSDAEFFRQNTPKYIRDTGFPELVEGDVVKNNPELSYSVHPGGKTVPGRYIPGGFYLNGAIDVMGTA